MQKAQPTRLAWQLKKPPKNKTHSEQPNDWTPAILVGVFFCPFAAAQEFELCDGLPLPVAAWCAKD